MPDSDHRPSRRELLSGAVGAAGAAGVVAVASIPSSSEAAQADIFTDDGAIRPPAWVRGVTRMTFLSPSQLDMAASAGVQVAHTNLIWPYYPLRRDGGGLGAADTKAMHDLCDKCHTKGMRLVLGLPPFPNVALVSAHPDWRVHPDRTGAAAKVTPREEDLGTRIGCNVGPWGDYLIDVCAEMVADFGVDGYSFDGNYHPPICYCSACEAAWRADMKRELPVRVNLDDVAYREYLVWRGERLEDHYRRLQTRIKAANRDAVLMSWTVNAGRYGHFLTSPRVMSTRMNRLFDLPMQEWWLDETNQGASVVPSFGAAYVRAVAGDRTAASEPYLMTRGNPYGTDSFPQHERRARCLLAVMSGGALAESLGWPGHQAGVLDDFRAIGRIAPFLTSTKTLPWAALLVSEQTRQFYAYRDIAEWFLPPVLGVWRAALEEHLPVTIVNDWDVTRESLARHDVLILPNAAALSDAQVAAVREYARGGGGVVATCETSLCDELGRPRRDFGLADMFGVSYQGRPENAGKREKLDANFAITIDENYWRQRVGVATLQWSPGELTRDPRLDELVPSHSTIFRGPQALVSEPASLGDVVVRLKPEGWTGAQLPGMVAHAFGKGRVVYLAAGIDAALWSYAYPWQRRLLVRAIEWASRRPAPVTIKAPMCVQAACFEQPSATGHRLIVHLFNGLNTAGGHGSPAADVPLREETIPIHGIEVRFHSHAPRVVTFEPDRTPLPIRREGGTSVVTVPPLALHGMIVAQL